MMKKMLYTIGAALVLLLGAGCEKVIEFKGEVTEPRLTVSGQAEVGEPLTVYVASSLFFLTDERVGAAFTDGLDTLRGQVRCYVNGAKAPHILTLQPRKEFASALPYQALDYSPAPGDRIRLEAEFPGFDPVWAETAVPLTPAFEIVSAQWRRMTESQGLSWMAGEEGEEAWYNEVELTLAVTDDASYDKFYFIQPAVEYHSELFGKEEDYFVSYGFSSSDILFREMSGSNAVRMIDEEGNYFSDKLIKGQRREFTITVSMLPENDGTMRFWIHSAAVNESLYWFDYSYSQVREGATGLFAEGVTLYSNVNGGYGVFGAAASRWLEVDW